MHEPAQVESTQENPGAIRIRQDFSDRGADQKSLLDGALRRGSGEREAWIGPVAGPKSGLNVLIV